MKTMRYKECEITVDPQYGDGLIFGNRKTVRKVNDFFGQVIVIDERIADDFLACNQRTFDGLPKEIITPLPPKPTAQSKVPTRHEDEKEVQTHTPSKIRPLHRNKGGFK